MTMANQLIAESMWNSIAKWTKKSECHCQCGETFSSLAHYIGKKTGSVSQRQCPSCGSYRMAYVLPQTSVICIPTLKCDHHREGKDL